MNPMDLLRKSANPLEESVNGLMPSMSNSPWSGRSKVPNICSKVVFPAPEDPTMEITSPEATVKSTPFKIERSPYAFCIPVAFSI